VILRADRHRVDVVTRENFAEVDVSLDRIAPAVLLVEPRGQPLAPGLERIADGQVLHILMPDEPARDGRSPTTATNLGHADSLARRLGAKHAGRHDHRKSQCASTGGNILQEISSRNIRGAHLLVL